MKKIFLIGLFILLIGQLLGQVCNADFGYIINSNNFVTFTDSSTSSCPTWSGCCLSFNYGDTSTGQLNNWCPWGFNHFYKNPGTYTVCETLSYQYDTCSCFDTTCKQIVIADTGSNCQADYCYTAIDTLGMLKVILINTSTSDDSITDVYWDFNDGNESTQYTNVQHYYTIPVPNQLTYLYIQTENGCQSVIVDTIQVGSNCDTVPEGIINQTLNSNDFSFKIYPTIIQSTATIESNILGEKITLKIFDLLGREVRHIDISTGKSQFERKQIKSGLYFYMVSVNNKIIKTGKLLFD